jgi:hypothetical protein
MSSASMTVLSGPMVIGLWDILLLIFMAHLRELFNSITAGLLMTFYIFFKFLSTG